MYETRFYCSENNQKSLSIFIFTVLTLLFTKNLLDEELHVDGVVLGVVLVVVDIGMGWDYGRNYLDGDVHEEMR